MTTFNRWAVVALGLIVVVATLVAVRVWPPPTSDVTAGALLAQVREAEDRPYAGFVVTQGTLALPVASRFTDLGTLFGEQNRLRVWWQSSDAWRVNRLLVAGEEDLVHDGRETTAYAYEDAEATTSKDPGVRLPRTADLLPPELTRRLLTDVDPDDVTRLGTRRIAGRVAPGLRLEPASEQSSIGHVDLWADPDTGIPLRVEVFATGATDAGLTTSFSEFTADRPADERVTFTPSATTDTSFEDVLDIADAANQYAPLRPPDTVAGLPETSDSQRERGAVGVYGSGLTQLIAIPLRGREAEPLRRQIGITPDAVVDDDGTLVQVGPLGVLVTGSGDDGGWLITGSVTASTLTTAAVDLSRGTVFLEDER